MNRLKLISFSMFLTLIFMGQGFTAVGSQLTDNSEKDILTASAVHFKSVTIKKLNAVDTYTIELRENLNDQELPDFGSAWSWPEFTLEMVNSYTPFIFRTEKSAAVDEVRIILNVNNRGKLVGYEFLSEADRGLEQRIAHVLRKLPNCNPVPGYEVYEATDFELIIKK